MCGALAPMGPVPASAMRVPLRLRSEATLVPSLVNCKSALIIVNRSYVLRMIKQCNYVLGNKLYYSVYQ